MLTIHELQEKLVEQVDEIDLLDLLGITAQDLVYAFVDKVEDNYDKLIEELELE